MHDFCEERRSIDRRFCVHAPASGETLLHRYEVGVGEFDGGAALLPHLFQEVEPVVDVEMRAIGRAEAARLLGGEELAGRVETRVPPLRTDTGLRRPLVSD